MPKNPLIQSVVKSIQEQKKPVAIYSVPKRYKSTFSSFLQGVRRNLKGYAVIGKYDEAKKAFTARIK